MDGPAWTYEALPKAALYVAVLVIVGTVATRWLLIRFCRSSISAVALSECERALAKSGFAASSLALVALAGRLFTHTAVTFGLLDALHWDNLHVIAIESRWGQAWRLQVYAAAGLMLSVAGIRLRRRVGWLAFTATALTLCAMIPRLGHGATSDARLLMHSLHLLAVSIWLGTLAVIVALYFWGGSGCSVFQVRAAVAILVSNFSAIALSSAALVTVTGVIAASIYIGRPSNLFITSYGRTLLVKLIGFVGILTCGWRNWRHVRNGEPPRPQTLVAELVFAAAVVLVTGILTEMDHP